MVGNENDARTALRDYEDGWMDYLFSGQGSSRSVHEINGVLYKVDMHGYGTSFNRIEWENTRKMLKNGLPEGVAIPDMSLYEIDGCVVLAVEPIEGYETGECVGTLIGTGCDCDAPCLDRNFLDMMVDFGWYDHSWGNAIQAGNTLYLVDCG